MKRPTSMQASSNCFRWFDPFVIVLAPQLHHLSGKPQSLPRIPARRILSVNGTSIVVSYQGQTVLTWCPMASPSVHRDGLEQGRHDEHRAGLGNLNRAISGVSA